MKSAAILLRKRNFFLAAGFAAMVARTAAVIAADKPDEPTRALASQVADAVTSEQQQALIASAPPDLRGKALRRALLDIEYRLVFEGDYAKAERLCFLVERLAREANDPQDVARSQVQLSSIWRELGDDRGTLAALDRALGYFEQHPDDPGIVGAYQGRGITYIYEGDFARALVNLNAALSTAERLKFREGIIPALNSIGEVYREQGLPERALDFYEKARAVVGDDNAWNMAFIFNNIGQAYEATGDRAKAAEFIEKARAVAEKSKMRPRVATSLALLGKIAMDGGEFDRAQQLYQQSLALGRELRDATAEGRALLGLAEVARQTNRLDEAQAQADEAAAIFRSTAQVNWLVAALTSGGRTLRARGDQSAARAKLEEAISLVESMRDNVAGAESETQLFFEKHLAPYNELVSLFADNGDTSKAFEAAERASARVLLDVISGRGGRVADAVSETEAARQRELERRIAELNRRVSAAYAAEKRDDQQLAELTSQLERARHEREDFEAQLAAAHPEVKRRASTATVRSLRDLAPLLQDGTVAIKFSVTAERCYVFVLRQSEDAPRVELTPLSISRDELSKRAAAFRTALAQRSLTWQQPARELYDALLAPSEQFWRNAKRLIIAPDGPVWEVPFNALLDSQNRPLVEQLAISLAPSLSAVAEQEQRVSRTTGERLVIFANPPATEKPTAVADAAGALTQVRWPPLPQMEKQARALEKLYPAGHARSFIGAAAREETAKRELPAADLIEFATHGVLNDRAPLYSYLLLSQRDLRPNEDGLLEARELMRIPLRARLAILCGCETARGRISGGEGVIGLSWSLLVAGCPATVVSQWKVDEAATTPLMLSLHRALLAGTPQSEALRRAVAEMRKDERYRHPFYWAPFVLVGDPR